ncbi:MAG: flagellar transcriptional regulator FlhD [Anaerolineae bacterium]|nr:flagellar transcriptional regulator FlhD [Anaerolineae bacterium]MCI0652977.1 flagellar transcriptional regulator FlhD [Methylococcaceae bacterium]
MEIDFSQVNLQYLIQARDLAKIDREKAAVILGVDVALTELFAQVTSVELTHFSRIRVPLIKPHEQIWWWSRFLRAIKTGDPAEIEPLLEHANLVAIQNN